MEAADRDETEAELAAVILLLWIIFSDLRRAGVVPYPVFLDEFNRLVRPHLTRIYGRARASLADAHGHPYPTRDLPAGGQSILIPGLTDRIDRYAQELYDRFGQRQRDIEARRSRGEGPPDTSTRTSSRRQKAARVGSVRRTTSWSRASKKTNSGPGVRDDLPRSGGSQMQRLPAHPHFFSS